MKPTESEQIKALKRKAVTRFHEDHNDGDLAIYEFAKGVQALITAARLDELELIPYVNDRLDVYKGNRRKELSALPDGGEKGAV